MFRFNRGPAGGVLLMLGVLATGCASSGAVPRPRPFPGASLPPEGTIAAPPAPAEPDGPAGAEPRAASPAEGAIPLPIVADALTFRGTPYRNGGSDPSGFDCSGFVQWVFALHGIALPREVRDQYRVGSEVDDDEVQPGDLVFFETVARGASHVGIAIGNGEFVHAPSSRGVVRVERYTGAYWAPRWIGARRVGRSERTP
jgi:cell wall-associated NlpC family hydrolase